MRYMLLACLLLASCGEASVCDRTHESMAEIFLELCEGRTCCLCVCEYPTDSDVCDCIDWYHLRPDVSTGDLPCEGLRREYAEAYLDMKPGAQRAEVQDHIDRYCD